MLLSEYDTNWSVQFNSLKEQLKEALGELAISIEHIGSTAVPGLAAKPIIDIDIIMAQPAVLEEIKTRLATIGYLHHGDQGIPGREVFKRNQSAALHSVMDAIPHHLYVCAADNAELRRHLLFRNYLAAHRETRILYQTLKYKIAAAALQDRKKYAALKEVMAGHFIEQVLAAATEEKGTG